MCSGHQVSSAQQGYPDRVTPLPIGCRLPQTWGVDQSGSWIDDSPWAVTQGGELGWLRSAWCWGSDSDWILKLLLIVSWACLLLVTWLRANQLPVCVEREERFVCSLWRHLVLLLRRTAHASNEFSDITLLLQYIAALSSKLCVSFEAEFTDIADCFKILNSNQSFPSEITAL